MVLLPEARRSLGNPSAYRPKCLNDTAGKVLEKIILNILLRRTEAIDGLSSNQLCFWKPFLWEVYHKRYLAGHKTAEIAFQRKMRVI